MLSRLILAPQPRIGLIVTFDEPSAPMRPKAATARVLRWHRYDNLAPSPHLEPLLAEIEEDPTAIFWG